MQVNFISENDDEIGLIDDDIKLYAIFKERFQKPSSYFI